MLTIINTCKKKFDRTIEQFIRKLVFNFQDFLPKIKSCSILY